MDFLHNALSAAVLSMVHESSLVDLKARLKHSHGHITPLQDMKTIEANKNACRKELSARHSFSNLYTAWLEETIVN